LSGTDDKELDVSIRFVISPFEVAVKTKAKRAELAGVIIDLVNEIKQKQNDLAESVTGIDLTKFKPVGTPPKAASEDPMERLAERIGVTAESLKQILRIEDKMPIITARDKFGSPEKGAMVLIYAYQFGVGKKPNHDEVSAAFNQSGFTPAFGTRTKGNLKKQKKISIEKGEISLTGSGISDAEMELRRLVPTAPK
jgi:hypothetical protein